MNFGEWNWRERRPGLRTSPGQLSRVTVAVRTETCSPTHGRPRERSSTCSCPKKGSPLGFLGSARARQTVLASPPLSEVSLGSSKMSLHPSGLGSNGTFSERPSLTTLLSTATPSLPPSTPLLFLHTHYHIYHSARFPYSFWSLSFPCPSGMYSP